MGQLPRGPEPTKVQVSVDDTDAIEWAIDRNMRLLEIRPTPDGHVAVMERFGDTYAAEGFPLIPGHRIEGGPVYLRYMTSMDAAMIFESDIDGDARRWALTPPKSLEQDQDYALRGYISWRLTQQSALTIASTRDDCPVGLLKVRKLASMFRGVTPAA